MKDLENSSNTRSMLTSRQINIIKYLARGLTEIEIAAELKISISTVKYHKSKIFTKLNVKCATQAIAKCITLGFVDNC